MSNPPAVTKILFFAADPSDTARLRLGREAREIETCWRQSSRRDQFAVDQSLATRPRDLRQQILNERPAVVHFSGHGVGDGGLALEDDRGRAKLLSAEALADLFRLFEGRVGCVILNSCFSAVQAEVIARHVPYVIGMKQEIGDRAAIDFAAGFYDALFAGEQGDRAFEFGRSAIQLESLPDDVKADLGNRALLPKEGATQALPEHLKPVLLGKDALLSVPSAGGSQTGQHRPLAAPGSGCETAWPA